MGTLAVAQVSLRGSFIDYWWEHHRFKQVLQYGLWVGAEAAVNGGGLNDSTAW